MSKWTNDSQRLLLEHFDAIRDSPSYIYHSALPFSPSSSWLQKCYNTDLSLTVKVVKGVPAEWGMCSRITLLRSYTRALSYWNNIVTVGSASGDIIILDTITGSQSAILSEHTDEVNCLTFSSDGTLLVSGSNDCTVKLWDVQTGGVIKTFLGHNDSILSVSISADCTMIVSGSADGSFSVWDIQTGEQCCTIKHSASVDCVSFSPTNPQCLISISYAKAQHWDTNSDEINSPFSCSCIAYSSDGAQFISCYGVVVTVKNSDSRAIITEFEGANQNIQCCCLSPDSRLVAVAAGHTIHVWDLTSFDPHLVETFLDHTKDITSLVFSSSSTLISASMDRSVRFWQIGVLSADPTVTDPLSTSITLPLLSSNSLQAKDGVAISSDVDGVVKTWDIPASLCRASSKSLAEYYKDRNVKLIDSKLVFVWYRDEKISIWDPKKGKFLLQADVSESYLLDLRISWDGSKIFCIKGQFIQAWDIWTGDIVGKTEFWGYYGVKLLTMDGLRVWMHIPGLGLKGWDFGIPGLSPIETFDLPPKRLYLNDTKVWDNSQYSIQDTVTRKVVFQLPRAFKGHIVEVQWNGQYLAISFRFGEELILEFHPAFLQ